MVKTFILQKSNEFVFIIKKSNLSKFYDCKILKKYTNSYKSIIKNFLENIKFNSIHNPNVLFEMFDLYLIGKNKKKSWIIKKLFIKYFVYIKKGGFHICGNFGNYTKLYKKIQIKIDTDKIKNIDQYLLKNYPDYIVINK